MSEELPSREYPPPPWFESNHSLSSIAALSTPASVVVNELRNTLYQREEKAAAAALSAGEVGSRGTFNTLYGGTEWAGSVDQFPDWGGVVFTDDSGLQSITHAYGAFQFEPATWRLIAGLTGKNDVRPASQILNGLYLAYRDFKRRSGIDFLATLKVGDLDKIPQFLRATWPGGASASFPAIYTAALDLFPVAPPIVVPPPVMPPVIVPSPDDTVEITITTKMKLSDFAKLMKS